MAVAALVCGILGLVGGFLPVIQYFTLVLSVLAIIFGAIARKNLKATGQPTGMATAGFVLGIISVGLTLIAIFAVVSCCSTIASMSMI